jgi:hypothetical protein
MLKLQRMKYLYLSCLFAIACMQPPGEQASQIDTLVEEKIISPDRKIEKPAKVADKLSPRDLVLSDAVAISNDFYNNLLVQNYPAANKYLHPDALSVTTPEQWIEIYKKAQDKTGKLGFVKMVGHGAKCGLKGGNGMGDYAELIFDAQYKDGNLREKLIFFRKDSTEKLKILGYEYHAVLERITLSEVLK